jgi:HEPN domain-containing protein
VTEYWVQDAGAELDAAVILLEHGKYRAACYHGQQCAEKALKAFYMKMKNNPILLKTFTVDDQLGS